ncbi:MAG TPA: GNAT family N-acetyltransferase [Anaerolineales bacterium]|jgi:RimJ/RimL family protein N-acetyltransferase
MMMQPSVLRDVMETDLPIFFEHQQDPEANRMAAFPARDLQAFRAHWARILADAGTTIKTILYDGQVAGHVVSWEASGGREVGYWIGKQYWGKGIATTALSEFLQLVRARPLFAHVAKHNIGSRRVLEKCGFKLFGEGRFPAADGEEPIDELILKLET